MVFCGYSSLLRQDITEILLKVALNTINLNLSLNIIKTKSYVKILESEDEDFLAIFFSGIFRIF
jgi:hypothetical protein